MITQLVSQLWKFLWLSLEVLWMSETRRRSLAEAALSLLVFSG